MNKNKKYLIVFGIFALVIVTTAVSFAFFTYSRVGETTTTVTSGDIEFTFIEGDDASLANAFPVKDEIGAQDTTEEYLFRVNMKSSSTANKMNYNVILLDANDDENTNYFNNEQIKFALIKNDVYVAGTSSTSGVTLANIAGFSEGSYKGEGPVLENQEIIANTTDYYKLRIWISDEVDYSNTTLTDDETDELNDTQESIGKYNGYKYSLRVKIGSGIANSIVISNLKGTVSKITANISDVNGLSHYAVTKSSTPPENGSSDWVEITNDTAKGNITKVSDSLVTSKALSHKISGAGTYYLHVKNKLNQTKSASVVVKAGGQTAANFIMNLAEENPNQIRIDEHAATGQQTFATKEYRYWGATPDNYVSFNDELWRVIGVFDVDDGTGNVEKRVKIIRANSIGNYSWDSSDANTNRGHGVNEWSQADVMTLLNEGAYYNRTTGTCYNGRNNASTSCNFTTTGLTNDAKEMIGDAKWYLGASVENNDYLNSSELYTQERGTLTGKVCSSGDGCNDSVKRNTYWIGQIGLMYPSDYGYSANIASCSLTNLISYNSSCRNSSWLWKSGIEKLMLNPRSYSVYAEYIYYMTSGGQASVQGAADADGVFPVTYLLPDVKIIDGLGTDQQPYILSN